MGIDLRVGHDPLTLKPIVEVLKDGELVACISDHDGGLRVAGEHLDGVDHEAGNPPALVIKFTK